MGAITGTLEESRDQLGRSEDLIKYKLYGNGSQDRPLEGIPEAYTPESVRQYTPVISLYDRLVPRADQRKAGETLGSTIAVSPSLLLKSKKA